MRKVPVLVISSLLFAGAGVGVHAEAAVHPSAKVASGPRLKVSLSSDRHAISRYIYGMNFAGAKLERELRLPVVRWGGNAATRYNYLLDTANHASDWYFENIPNRVANPKALPNGSSSDRFIQQNRADGAASLITVPLIGWTPKSRALSCGFSVKKYGKQQASDPYNPNCGNGVRPNSSSAPQVFTGGHARVTLPGYSITEYVINAAGLTRSAALLARAHSTAVPGAISVPGARPGPADAFRWAVGYKGRKIKDGWGPAAG
ncbi:MAG TPA: glycoside hydrolase family 44 protein [Streptosporangiaceae bacterium]|nr:glycoside hydrolase family 44 protein [Streptosporangiaceae bacterium]